VRGLHEADALLACVLLQGSHKKAKDGKEGKAVAGEAAGEGDAADPETALLADMAALKDKMVKEVGLYRCVY
jgi:hypothetical protein